MIIRNIFLTVALATLATGCASNHRMPTRVTQDQGGASINDYVAIGHNALIHVKPECREEALHKKVLLVVTGYVYVDGVQIPTEIMHASNRIQDFYRLSPDCQEELNNRVN